jgi:hypothetical protein
LASSPTNELLLNPIISHHFADGWAPGSSPQIAANLLDSGKKWTVPVGGGLSKMFRVGEQSIQLGLYAYYNAIRPNAGKDPWQLQFKLTFIFSEPGPSRPRP